MRYVVLLRGINVGGNNTVSMSNLKQLCESLGYTNVKTYINSGNLIFSTDQLPLDIEKNLTKTMKQTFGFKIQSVIRDSANIQSLVSKIPKEFENNVEQKTDILFLWDDYTSKKSLELIRATPGVDTLIYINGAIVWHIDRKNYKKSGMQKFIGTTLYQHMTARNVNTVRKLAVLLKDAP